MATVAVIQARTGSTRLPGKVLEPLGGKPLLVWTLEAALRATLVDEVILATTVSPGDDAVVEVAARLGVKSVRGSELDVLGRFLLAIDETGARDVVRLTGDCPLLDADLVDRAVDLFRSERADYVYIGPEGGFPRGVDTEVVAAATLRQVAETSLDAADREHVTRFVRQRPQEFRLVVPEAEASLRRPYRLCVDEGPDLAVVRGAVAALGANARSLANVIGFLDDHPAIATLNQGIEQKKL